MCEQKSIIEQKKKNRRIAVETSFSHSLYCCGVVCIEPHQSIETSINSFIWTVKARTYNFIMFYFNEFVWILCLLWSQCNQRIQRWFHIKFNQFKCQLNFLSKFNVSISFVLCSLTNYCCNWGVVLACILCKW